MGMDQIRFSEYFRAVCSRKNEDRNGPYDHNVRSRDDLLPARWRRHRHCGGLRERSQMGSDTRRLPGMRLRLASVALAWNLCHNVLLQKVFGMAAVRGVLAQSGVASQPVGYSSGLRGGSFLTLPENSPNVVSRTLVFSMKTAGRSGGLLCDIVTALSCSLLSRGGLSSQS